MTDNEALILPFAQIRAIDLPLVGGKGANLGEMSEAGFPVPAGFCLTTAAFNRFIAACPDSTSPYALLDTVIPEDVETVRTVGQRVRQLLLEVPIPREVAAAVLQAWRAAGASAAYAVRSSATAEDLPDASFAGQQDTYLNVRGEADLLDAIRRCWVSLFTDRAILYRLQNGFPHRDVQLSVVVQKMVLSEKAGILFTADPLTGHRQTLSIDASFGLGEALVGGLVSPDSYRVDKRDRTILSRQIAKKQLAILPDKGGGTRQETLDPDQQEQTVLTDAQILDLAEMGCQVEAHYSIPQDIEWAIADDQIYLLQARPITSLYPIDGLTSPDDSLHIFFSMGHQQNMTRAMAPLSLSSFPLIIPVGHGPDGFDNPLLRNSGGRLFIDLTTGLRHPIFRKVLAGGLSQFDALAPEAFRIAMRRPEFQGPHGISLSFSAVRGLAGFFSQVMHALWRQDLTGFVPRTDALISQYLEDVEAALQEIPTGKAQIQAMVNILRGLYRMLLNWAAQFIAGEAAIRLIARVARGWANPDDLAAVSLGLPGNAVTEMNLAVGDLADLARRSPPLVDWFDHLGEDSASWLAQVAEMPGSAPFLAAWDDFLAQYGARGPSEIDIATLHWYEEPLPLLKVIASYLQKEAGSHRIQQQALIQARENAVENILAGSQRGLLGGLRTRLLKRLIAALSGSVLREHHKFMAVQVLRIIKEKLKGTARQLVEDQKLSHPDDIWFLTWAELLAIWDDETGRLAASIPARRARLARYQKLAPPLVITSDGESPVVRYQVEDAPPGALVGNPVSAGVVEGTVRVVHDPQTESLEPGEILVAVFTDPGWTPLFINAGGLIMEIGGVMNHGSVVAREYGIPAIVGVREATKILQTGQKVRVDGNRGIIEIL